MMKNTILLLLMLVFVLSPAVKGDPLGVGAFAGALIPVVQEDQGSGYVAGVKARVNLPGMLAVEPNITFGDYGEATIEGVGTRDGSTLRHFGVDLLLGGGLAAIGPKPYFFVGGAIYNTKRDGDETTNKAGWSFGLGVSLGLANYLDVDVRGRANIATSEGSSSKKSVEVTGGAIYYFGVK